MCHAPPFLPQLFFFFFSFGLILFCFVVLRVHSIDCSKVPTLPTLTFTMPDGTQFSFAGAEYVTFSWPLVSNG
jgi:hypothetical protein